MTEKPVGIGESSGIAVDLRHTRAQGHLEKIAAAQRGCRAEDCEANAARDRNEGGGVGRDLLDGVYGEVDCESGLVVGCGVALPAPWLHLPRSGVGERGGSVCFRGPQGAHGDDPAAHRSAQTVGVGLQGCLPLDGRLDLGTPAADADPKRENGEPSHCGSMRDREDGQEQQRGKGGCEDNRRLPLPRQKNAYGEGQRGHEQRHPPQPERLDRAERALERTVRHPECGSTDSRHEKRYLAKAGVP